MPSIIEKVAALAGSQRCKTFAAAARFIMDLPPVPLLIETGCYRGNPADGQSTLILALLAKEMSCDFYSYDNHIENINLSLELLTRNGLDQNAEFMAGDSIVSLRELQEPVSFAYLDSYDFEENKPMGAQAHQLVEAGLLLPRMEKRSAFLLDDCDLPHGGKARLSQMVIQACGYTLRESGYQQLWVRG